MLLTPATAWARLLAGTLARTTAAVVIGLAVWAALPVLVGMQATTVMSESMAPSIRAGDVVAVHSAARVDLLPGRVLLVADPDHPTRQRLHRLARALPDGHLVLRGDANRSDDSSPVAPDAVLGYGVLRVPYAGLPGLWVRDGSWDKLLLMLALGGLLIVAARLDRDLRDDDDHHDHTDLPDVDPAPPTRRGRALRWRATAAAGAASFVMVVPPASAGLTGLVTNAGNSWAAQTYYTCAAAVTAQTPYLWYRLDEASGTSAADSSGNARTGTFRGTGTTFNATRACTRDTGRAVTLNGAQYISTATSISTPPNTFTLQTWFKTTTTTGGQLIGMGNRQTGASTSLDRQLYLTNTGRLVFGVNPATPKTVTSPTSYNDGQWHHATATLSTAGLRLYADGQLVASDPTTTTGGSTAGYWRIGYDAITTWPSSPTTKYVTATLDDIAIYTTALSATTISAQNAAGR